MNTVLHEHHKFSSAYLEDIVVFSPDWNTHLHHLQKILGALQGAVLHINAKKSRAGF